MNASYVEQNMIIDRYLLGKLSAAQAEEFEVLCLHDQNVLDQLELSEKMRAGFRRAAELNMLAAATSPAGEQGSVQRRPRLAARTGIASSLFAIPSYATAAALFLGICLLATVNVFSQREVPASVFEPQINTPVYELARTRSASGEPDYIVRIAAEPEWLVLSMPLGQVDYEQYRATLLDQNTTVVWQSDGLQPNYQDALTVSLNSARLEEGNYAVRIEGLAAGERPLRVAEYGFKARLRQ